jgi:hypothetical protein
MKKIDKNIQNIVIAILIIAFCFLAIWNIQIAKEVVVFIIIAAYFIFLGYHMVLFAPVVMIILFVSDMVEDTEFYNKIKEKSDYLAWWSITIPIIVVMVIIYYLIPVLTCMLYLETFSFMEGAKQLSKIIK